MNCLENLKKCNAACCRYFVFTIKNITPDQIKYYEAHENTKVKGNQVIVTNKCKYLDNHNRCKVYHRPELRPKMCGRPGSYSDSQAVTVPENCIYGGEK